MKPESAADRDVARILQIDVDLIPPTSRFAIRYRVSPRGAAIAVSVAGALTAGALTMVHTAHQGAFVPPTADRMAPSPTRKASVQVSTTGHLASAPPASASGVAAPQGRAGLAALPPEARDPHPLESIVVPDIALPRAEPVLLSPLASAAPKVMMPAAAETSVKAAAPPRVAEVESPTAHVTDGPAWLQSPSPEIVERYYPLKAYAAGAPGRVDLSCLEMEDGRVVQCRVLSETPSANGFGSAAVRLSRWFRFTPAMSGGQAVRTSLRFSYSFTVVD